MKYFPMRWLWTCPVLACFIFDSPGLGEERAPPVPEKKSDAASDTSAPATEFTLRLLPKAFQKDPELNMTVITEMTKEGLKQPQASPENPVYYGMHSLGLQTFGEGDSGKKVIPIEALKTMMQGALARNGYLTAKVPGHPPTLVLVYEWGLHAKIHNDQNSNAEIADLIEKARNRYGGKFADDVEYELEHSPETRLRWLIMNFDERRNLAQRAALVGGEQFASDFRQALENTMEETKITRDRERPPNYWPEEFGSPLHNFITSNPKTAQLFEQAAYDVYFVEVAAYEYGAYLRGEKRALWITKMTVNTEGVSMVESLPPLISVAAPYFGRQMAEPATLAQHLHRDVSVEIGPLKVVSPESETTTEAEKK